MNINEQVLQCFWQDQPIDTPENSWLYDLYEEGKHLFHTPDPKRKEVTIELARQLHILLKEGLFFNHSLFTRLFPEWETILEPVTIYLVVGAPKPYDVAVRQKDGAYLFLIDLHQIADYVNEVHKMIYIIRNFLTKECAHFCIHQAFPYDQINRFADMMRYLSFDEGLATYLSWGEDASHYQLNTEKYEEYRKHAFIMMKMALIEKDAQNQQSAIQIATSGSFWERFPTISGLFLWDILYREHGIDAFHQIYLAGWEGFLPVAES